MNFPRLGFIGAGNMASAIIGGLRAEGYPADNIIVSDTCSECLQQIEREWGISARASNSEVVAEVDVLVLAVKPQVVGQVCTEIQAAVREQNPLVVSIAAGIRVETLQRWLGDTAAIVRCMPNTPCLVKTGASGLVANGLVSSLQRQQAQQLLEAVGLVVWVEDEAQLDAVTAVSGSGPAYYFLMMEAMIAAGKQLGLDEKTATQLTLQTALGAAKMALASDVDPAELRRRVTSPNGTTERAIQSFEENDLRAIFSQALNACAKRSEQLAEELDKD